MTKPLTHHLGREVEQIRSCEKATCDEYESLHSLRAYPGGTSEGDYERSKNPRREEGFLWDKNGKINIDWRPVPARGEVNDVHGEGSGWNRVLFEMRLQKGGPISSVMRTSINTKEELTVFWRRKREGENKTKSILFFVVVLFCFVQLILYIFCFRQSITTQHNTTHHNTQQWIPPRSLTLYYLFSYLQSLFF